MAMPTVRNGLLFGWTVVLIASVAWVQHRPPCRGGEHLTATGWCEGGAPAAPARGGGRPRRGHGGRAVLPAPAVPPAPAVSCPEGLVYVPGGTVDGHGVEGFCLDRTEVTVAAYRGCVDAGACADQRTGFWLGQEQAAAACNLGRTGVDDHPMNCVDQTNATRFCEWRTARLPTEWEWQFAAQGTDGRTYPWGSAEPSNQLCWSGVNPRSGTCAVGSFPAGRSPYGAEDMSGNVWEWTSTAEGADRVIRGGAWYDRDAAWVRAAARDTYAPANRFNLLGFRCARGAL